MKKTKKGKKYNTQVQHSSVNKLLETNVKMNNSEGKNVNRIDTSNNLTKYTSSIAINMQQPSSTGSKNIKVAKKIPEINQNKFTYPILKSTIPPTDNTSETNKTSSTHINSSNNYLPKMNLKRH